MLPPPSAAQRSYDAAWRRLRAVIIRRDCGLCQQCLREGRHNTVGMQGHVDHIIPHRGDNKLRMDPKNLQSLCKPHHSRKTATEDSTFAKG